MAKYIVIDHPSDIGIEVYGKCQKELFGNAAYGMTDMMFELARVKTDQTFEIKTSANNLESLLISWLSELLYVCDSKKIALSKFEIKKLTDKELEAKVLGGKISGIKRYIKAATYNQLEIKKEKNNWKARIIFDV